jgi:hypothetical protein
MPKKKKLSPAEQAAIEAKKIDNLIESVNNNSSLTAGNFVIPDSFLKQLVEFTNGGFTLFTFDSTGSPKVYQTFDSDVHSLAMSNFIRMYGNCMENIHGSILMNNLTNDDEDSEE